MSETPKDGGPAFPQAEQKWQDNASGGRYLVANVAGGMSLRDWFAGQALAGILANTTRIGGIESTAEGAFAFADAMLAARGAA